MDNAVPDSGRLLAADGDAEGLEFLVLGPLDVRRSGRSIPVGGPKQRGILAILLANAGRPVSIDGIVDGVYGEQAALGARHSVQTYISTIRRDLGDVVRRDAGGYVLTVDAACIDANRFEACVRSALPLVAEEPETASAILRDALAMWRGHPYADLNEWGTFEPEITRLSELRLSALEGRIDADLALRRHRELLGELEALTLEHPLRERFRAQQILALYRSDRQTEALRAYARTREYLADEVGIDPSPQLQNLEKQILDQDPDLELPAAPAVSRVAVCVVQVADTETLMRLDAAERAAVVDELSHSFEASVERHGGSGFAQRGSALYATFATVREAVETVADMASAARSARLRIAIDYGDVEVGAGGKVSGPPLRRSAGIVAAAHGGQVLLSAGAHEAMLAEGMAGWLVRSLGSHPIHRIDEPQQVFQLVLGSQDVEFPPLRLDITPPALPVDRSAVAGYELRNVISSDLSGTTYRAYQPSMGREVVVTMIDPARANEAEFISRFEVETQVVTRLQHPHILPVLDYWRDPTGAYLVAPRVGGSSLSHVIASTHLSEGRRRRVISQIGAALSYAHRFGVVHGAVSPDSVVLDDSANAYLPGTGFVVRLAAAPRTFSPHLPPEHRRHDPITPASDVYGLGRLAGDLLSETARPDAAALLAGLVARATADCPQDRFASVDDFLTELTAVVGEDEASPVLRATRNPYRGLDAFSEADAGDFFGRSAAVAEITAMLAEHRLVAVVGPSGAGKSSLVKAGVIPAVRAGAINGTRRCLVTDMFPGSYPFVELESALARVAIEDPGGLLDELATDDRGLVRVIKRILPADVRLLLVIDQFEELFTLTRSAEERERFLDALVALAADQRSDVRIVVTLRADFFDRPLLYPVFGDLLRSGTFALTAMRREELAEAIERPTEAVGVTWQRGLVDMIVDDVVDEPGALPLLQYALTEVFQARQSDELDLEDYRAAGGVLGALGTRADSVFESLDSRQRTTARQLFLQLVTVQSTGDHTRHRARLVDLNAIAKPQDVDVILTAFGEARLVTFDRDPVTRGPTVEVAHEALLTHWRRLDHWIAESREDLLLLQRLADAVADWERQQRDDAYLLSGGRLAQFRAWARGTNVALTRAEAEYLGRSARHTEEERVRRRRIRNAVTAGFAVVAILATILGLLAFLNGRDAAAAADVARSRELGALSINVADEDPELSLLLALQAAEHGDPTLESSSVLHEALAEHRRVFTYTWPADEEFSQDLSTSLSPDGQVLVASSGSTYIEAVETDSGRRLWSRQFGGEGQVRALFTHDGSGVIAAYGWSSHEGTRRLDPTSMSLLGVHVLDATSGRTIAHHDIGPCGLVAQPETMAVAGSGTASYLLAPLNRWLVDCDYGGLRGADRPMPPWVLIDLATGEVDPHPSVDTWQLDDVGPFGPELARVSGDARFVVAYEFGPDNTADSIVIHRSSGMEVARLPGFPIAVSDDGSRLLTAFGPQLVFTGVAAQLSTWDVSTGSRLADLSAPVAALSPDGRLVAVPETGAVISIRDAATGEEIDRVPTGLGSLAPGSLNAMAGPSFSSDGSRLLITDVYGDTAVVVASTPAEIATKQLCPGAFVGTRTPVAIAGGTTVVDARCVSSSLHTIFVVDPTTFTFRASIDSAAGERSALSANGDLIAAQGVWAPASSGLEGAGPIELRESATGTIASTLQGLCEHRIIQPVMWGPGPDCVPFPDTPFADWVNDLDFSPDGTMLAMAGGFEETDAAVVWDTDTGEITGTATVPHLIAGRHWLLGVAFSPDGRRLAASFGGASTELWLISTETWEPISHYEAPPTAGSDEPPGDWLFFTPDGEKLIGTDVAAQGAGRIVFVDGATLEHIDEITFPHDGGITQLSINQDGTLLASSGADGFVRVWDVATLALVHEIPVSDTPVGGVAFEGRRVLATIAATGELRSFTIDTDELLHIARTRITRSFTTTECVSTCNRCCAVASVGGVVVVVIGPMPVS
jgi:DNA-binding SARP family transcriptional activator/WD40 repeat protein/energy-coupling factor transporter ATP-binding protein EcfA2